MWNESTLSYPGQEKSHMWRRWGTPQNFSLAFIDELEKQIIIKKTVEVGQQKQNNFNIYNVAFFKKI